jgi:methylenetetrahydrofolate dehydrogenase (NADP+) / methenyltetrahydrofolate cyclohydrolase
MDGRALAERIRAEVAEDIKELGEVGLSTILVGDDPASDIYIRLKQKAAVEVGILARDYRLSENTSEEELLELIDQLNRDDSVDGILVQLPLPGQIDEARAIEAVDPAKDVDGFHPVNAGRLFLGHEGVVAATPTGIMALLDEYDVPLEGARAVVVGRSNIVGKPVALLLLARNATVTMCHSRTADLAAHTRDADVLVVAVGQAGLVTLDMVREGRGRRHEPNRGGSLRRRRSRSDGTRRRDDACPRRRRADDDRFTTPEHRQGHAAQALLRSRALLHMFGGSVPGPSFVVEGGTIA